MPRELKEFVRSVLGEWILENAPEYRDSVVLLMDLSSRRRGKYLESDLLKASCYVTPFGRNKFCAEPEDKVRGFAIKLSYIPVMFRPTPGTLFQTTIGQQMSAYDDADAEELAEYVFDRDIVHEADVDTLALTDKAGQHTVAFLSGHVSRRFDENRDSNQPGALATKEAVGGFVDRLPTYFYPRLDFTFACHPSKRCRTIPDQVAMWR
jgi:hypothetical protein